MKEKELEIINVNKKYNMDNKQTFQALFDINVSFEKGELISIVGESGSGKSTLMNLIGGLDSDFTGTIISGGEDLSKLTDKQLDSYRKNKVGFVFQSFNLISHLSILDNVTLALTLSNVSEKEKIEKATKMLKKVGLEEHLKKKPTQLSGGQKQRVAIARALINDPEIIIADEPTGALDSDTSMQILNILKEIADSGKLVIMVTHSEKVASISSRVVELSDGIIIDDRKNKHYVKNPSNLIQVENKEAEAKEAKITEKILETTKPTKKCKKRDPKISQNLSMISAIRLSFHNMWAGKVKNFLMAFGVAIGIGSLILMMCFSSGITDFIDNTMKSYSDPTIVTVSKKDNSNNIASMLSYNPFSSEETADLIDDINAHLQEKNINYTVTNENINYGIQMMTMMSNAKVIYNPETTMVDYFDNTALAESGLSYDTVIYMYTTPPYYSDTNLLEGKMSTSDNGVMFSKTVKNLFEDNSITNEDGSNKNVDVCFTYTDANNKQTNLTFKDEEITAIVDTSVMSNYLVMYIDFEYFQKLFKTDQNTTGNSLEPNILYIKTDSAETTNEINNYLFSTEKYRGSVEEQLAGMFSNMSGTIGTSLIVISCISLMVSAMMILVVLYMSVSERTKEIGVLKSIGARRKDIKRIFTSESFLIGVLSGIFGIIFNLILTLVVWIILSCTLGIVPLSYRWWYFAIAMLVSIVISMLSGLYPASKAAKLDPVESLRRE